ncbi:aminotransferase class IV [Halanaerocella petrolearia]
MQNRVSFNSELAKFGNGVFETMKVHQGKVILLNKHLLRLYNSLDKLSISFKLSKEDLKQKILDYVKGVDDKAFRVTVCAEGYNFFLRDIPYQAEDYKEGYRLKIASIKRGWNPLYQHKTVNYLDNIYSKRQAVEQGYDEALFVNLNNQVLEGTMTNIFFLDQKNIYTPKQELGLLPGIIRNKVLELSAELGIEVNVIEIDLDKINEFDAAFVTNSLLDLMKVVEIEGVEYSSDNQVFAALNEEFKQRVYNK